MEAAGVEPVDQPLGLVPEQLRPVYHQLELQRHELKDFLGGLRLLSHLMLRLLRTVEASRDLQTRLGFEVV